MTEESITVASFALKEPQPSTVPLVVISLAAASIQGRPSTCENDHFLKYQILIMFVINKVFKIFYSTSLATEFCGAV